jgi:hypothetical protein
MRFAAPADARWEQDEQHVAFDRQDVGLPGMPKNGVRLAPMRANAVGCRLHRNPVKIIALCSDEIDDQIALADGASSGRR